MGAHCRPLTIVMATIFGERSLRSSTSIAHLSGKAFQIVGPGLINMKATKTACSCGVVLSTFSRFQFYASVRGSRVGL